MENNQQLTVRQEKLSNQIAEVGRLTELGFAKKTIEFDKVKTLLVSEEGREKLSFGLTMLFTRIPNLLGIKDVISDINKQDIKEMILSHYKTLSLEEIDYAFKIDRYSGEPIPHYQLFNAEYVAKVLKRYQEWLQKKRQDNNLSISKLPLPTEPSPEERKEIRRKFLKNVFDDIKNTGYCDDAWLIYDDLSAQNKILVGDSRKKEMYAQQLEKHIQEVKAGGFERSVARKIEKIKSGDTNAIIVNRCKNILVAEYLEEFEGDFEQFYKDLDN